MKDLKDKLKNLISEELASIMVETSGRAGGLLNPKNFDPVDPEVHIAGYGTMTRSALRDEIARRLEMLTKSAKQAAATETSYANYESMLPLLTEKGMIATFIKAELAVADELEAMRTQGGRRNTPIPKQK
jgi:hypothetical protein